MRPTILAIDDDPGVRTVLCGALDRDYHLITLPAAEGLKRAISSYRPDLIILDVNMPGTDGLKACKKLKKYAASKTTPVLFITVRDDDDTFIKSLEAGGNALLAKPFTAKELRWKVGDLLDENPG